ncbi:hypothetical protein Y1Q_0005767 [Alligator mississippiensis]|uniref:Uncharacterized protein n=1 Tax=Alligator mississippiensis TaxID=8496 RepID=A0A151MFV0_ALLMI|nr:hypothetical protein Y1Q_0005767 [Alligator mississippiensis]
MLKTMMNPHSGLHFSLFGVEKVAFSYFSPSRYVRTELSLEKPDLRHGQAINATHLESKVRDVGRQGPLLHHAPIAVFEQNCLATALLHLSLSCIAPVFLALPFQGS